MATVKSWIQDDFSGGQNDLVPAEQLDKNEVISLVNLLPGDSGQPVTLRGGAPTLCSPAVGAPINALYNYRRTADAGSGTSFYLVATASSVYRVTNLDTGAVVKCFDWTTSGTDTKFVTFLNRVFAMNGIDKPMVWDGTTAAWAALVGRNPTYDNPKLRYAQSFRGRIWGVGGDGNIWFCGTGDDEAISPVPAEEPFYYFRYQNWSGTLDSDGGSVNVGDDSGQVTTGLATLYNGVVVFKERMTYLWSYSESAHPADVDGSSIDVLVPGVGCAHHDTIQYQDGAIIFLGQNAASDYGVYRLSGQGIDDVAVKIPLSLKRVLASSSAKPRSVIYDHYYIIAADDYDAAGASRSLVFALDMKRKCWMEIEGWSVGGMAYSAERDKLLIASDAAVPTITQYPHGHVDGDSTPIHWRIKSRIIDGGNPLEDHRWRKAFVDVVSGYGEANINVLLDGREAIPHSRSWVLPGVDSWEPESYWVDGLGFDGSSWEDGSYWFSDSAESRLDVEMPYRSRTLQFDVEGEASVALSVKRIGLVFRPRKLAY